MTALVVGTVERTFSTVGRYLTGLPGPQTHEAGRQDIGDFGQMCGGRLSRHVDQSDCRNH